MQLRYDGRRVCVRSRPGRDCTAELPELAGIAGVLGCRRVILDGELVCLDREGRPDFAALRARLGRHPGSGEERAVWIASVTLVIFDVLHSDGWAVRRLPYARRAGAAGRAGARRAGVARATALPGQHEALVTATAAQGIEGVWPSGGRRRSGRAAQRSMGEDQGPPPRVAGGDRLAGSVRPGCPSSSSPGSLVMASCARSAALRFGLDASRRARVLAVLVAREWPSRGRRGRMRWAAAGVEVLVDAHGSPTRPVRDPTLRDIALP